MCVCVCACVCECVCVCVCLSVRRLPGQHCFIQTQGFNQPQNTHLTTDPHREKRDLRVKHVMDIVDRGHGGKHLQ
jgi:hypothetical protein